jgi:hypothetical protein
MKNLNYNFFKRMSVILDQWPYSINFVPNISLGFELPYLHTVVYSPAPSTGALPPNWSMCHHHSTFSGSIFICFIISSIVFYSFDIYLIIILDGESNLFHNNKADAFHAFKFFPWVNYVFQLQSSPGLPRLHQNRCSNAFNFISNW